MKKHFLLALLALFPLLGWAAVDPISLENFNLVVEKRDFVYTGKAQVPVVHELQDPNAVTINEQYFALKFYATQQSTDELNPEDIVNAGTYWVAAYGITELYQGETPRVQFNIIRKNLADADIIVEGVSDQTYTGSAITFDPLTVKYGDLTLTLDEDYIVSYDNNVEIGDKTAKVIITTPESDGNGNYYGTKEVTFSILAKSIASEDVTVTVTKNPAYINDFVFPTLEVKDGETVLVEGTDYELVNDTYKNAGAAEVSIQGKGNYAEERTQAFTITPRRIDLGVIKLEYTKELTYNGAVQSPAGTYKVTDTGVKGKPELVEGTDFSVEYLLADETWSAEADSKDVGEYNIRIKGMGNYNHIKPNTTQNPRTYTIVGKPITITADDLTVGYGTAVKPTATFSEEVDETIAVTFKYGETADDPEGAVETAPTERGTYYIYPVATSKNYELTLVPGKLTITKATLYLAVNDATINYGDAAPNFTLKVESGLAEDRFNAQNLSAAPTFKIDGNLDTRGYYPVKRDDANNVTAYTVSVNETNLVYDGNYNVIVKPGKLTVNPRNITLLQYFRWNIDTEPLPYNGREQTPETVTVTYRLNNQTTITLDPSEYEITAENNKDATNNALVTITGKGNFEGSHTETFQITRVPLKITADDMTVAYNELAATPFTYAVDGLQGEDKIEDLGTVKVENTSTNAVGFHEDALVPSGLGNRTTNYNVTYAPGDLTVTPAEALVQANDVTAVYGEEFALGWKYVSGLVEDEAAYWESLITGDAEYTIVDGEGNKVDTGIIPVGEYTIKVSGLSATDYTVKDTELGKLTITKKPIEVTACDQNVGQGKAPVLDVYYEETEDHIQTVIIPEDALVGDDELVLALECTATAVGENADAIKITFDAEAKPNCNYEITTVSGTLTVAGAEFIELARAAEWDNSALLADYDGQVTTVKIKGDELKKSWWYTLTLPFATTVADISDAFGYAAVDVPDLSNSDPKKVAFVLKVDDEIIPANTLLLIKIHKDRDLNDKPAVFELTEETPIEYNPESYVEDAAHNKYYTLYQNKALDPAENATCWYLYEDATQNPKYNMFYRAGARSSAWNVASFGGYFEAASAEPDAVRVYVQEEDGTITAINAMEINPQAAGEGWYTIDGMKLNAAPTQKGVYINNGKKVVVK